MKGGFAHIVLILLLFPVAVVQAQELWLRPDKYFYEPGEQAVVEVQQGENFIGEPVVLEREEIRMLETWTGGGARDLLAQYQKNEKGIIPVKLEKEGYQFLFMNTTQSYEIDAEPFNEYLKQYGLDEHYNDREKNGNTGANAKVTLTHHLQLSLRAGKEHAKGWNKPRNLPVEILPDKNPQTLRRGDRIHFRILENGKPAFGVRVKIWNRWDNRTTIQNIYTEQDGTISTTVSNPGDWMVTVVKLRKGSGGNDYIGDAYCLLFGYR